MKTKLLLFVSLLVLVFLSLDGVKNALSKEEVKKEFGIEANITLVPDGDVDNNGEIDAGDTVRFTYTITNTTDQEYSFGTLKTNIDRELINFIHNVHGTPSLNDDEKTITIPNLQIRPLGELTISFDARINYYDDKDRNLSTQAEYFSKDDKSILKSSLKQVTARKNTLEKLKSAAIGNSSKNKQ